MSRFFSILLLLFGVEFIAAGKPFQSGGEPHEYVFLLVGCILLGIWHAIIWDRGRDY
jgi:hypothetical protein